MREDHHLKEDPTEGINDYDLLLTQLERLKNAREIVISKPRLEVPARTKRLKDTVQVKGASVAGIESSLNDSEEDSIPDTLEKRSLPV